MSGENLRLPFILNLTTSIVVMGFIAIFFLVIAMAWPAVQGDLAGDGPLVFSWRWNPTAGEFGILPMVVGSLLLAILAVALAWPLALGLCALLVVGETKRGWVFKVFVGVILKGLVRFMIAIPTVIYGFVAIFLLVPIMQTIQISYNLEGGGAGLGIATASLTLAFLILPTMVLVMESGLRDRYQKIYLDAAALGFNNFQTLVLWVFPQKQTISVLLAALVLGFGRALGDTLISLMLAGGAPLMPSSLSASFRTLTTHLALVSSNEASGVAYNSLYAAGALLLIISFGVSISLQVITKGKRWL